MEAVQIFFVEKDSIQKNNKIASLWIDLSIISPAAKRPFDIPDVLIHLVPPLSTRYTLL